MDLSGIKNLAAGLYSQYFDAITVKRYTTSTNAATGGVSRLVEKKFTTGAKRKKFSSGYDVALISGTLANREYRRYEMVAANSSSTKELTSKSGAIDGTWLVLPSFFTPRAMDEVTTTDGTWQVVGCTPVDDGGVQVTYDLILVKL